MLVMDVEGMLLVIQWVSALHVGKELGMPLVMVGQMEMLRKVLLGRRRQLCLCGFRKLRKLGMHV